MTLTLTLLCAALLILAAVLDMRLFDRASKVASCRHMTAFLAERGPRPPENTLRARLAYNTDKVAAHTRCIEWYASRESEILTRPFGALYLTLRAKLTRYPWPEQPFPEHRELP